jgi:hypothetical protein
MEVSETSKRDFGRRTRRQFSRQVGVIDPLYFNLVGRLRYIVVGCFEDCNILFVTHGLGNIGCQFGVAQISRPPAPLSFLI